jgi:hypothetical protein
MIPQLVQCQMAMLLQLLMNADHPGVEHFVLLYLVWRMRMFLIAKT